MENPDDPKTHPTPANIQKLQDTGAKVQQLPGQDPRTIASGSFYDRLTANVAEAIRATPGVSEVREDLAEGVVAYHFTGDGVQISVVLTNHG